jgi:hypothetical protein
LLSHKGLSSSVLHYYSIDSNNCAMLCARICDEIFLGCYRLLRDWLCSPLCSIESIAQRQEAVSALIKTPGACDKVRKLLKDLPDIERLLMRYPAPPIVTDNLHVNLECRSKKKKKDKK